MDQKGKGLRSKPVFNENIFLYNGPEGFPYKF